MLGKQTNNGLEIRVRILPNAGRDELLFSDNEEIKVRLAAPPLEGKANKALIEFLAKQFKIPKTKIKILKGETSRFKTVCLQIEKQVFEQKLQEIRNI